MFKRKLCCTLYKVICIWILKLLFFKERQVYNTEITHDTIALQ